MKPTLLVLAAGMGSRYGSLKQIDKFGPSGEKIIDYSIYDAIRAGFGKVVFVIRESLEEEFKNEIFNKFSDKIEVEYVFQELDNLPEGVELPADRVKPWGTGHAVMVAKDKIQEPFAVINADDFYGSDAFKTMADFLVKLNPSDVSEQCMVGYRLENTLSEFGSVSRGICVVDNADNLESITERTQIKTVGDHIEYLGDDDQEDHTLSPDSVASMNLMGFTPAAFEYFEREFELFIKARGNELKSEFYLPSVVNTMIQEGVSKFKVLTTDAKWFGVTYKEDKEIAVDKIQKLVDEEVYQAPLW
ncbi:nucleotidyltransferase family protein [Sediminitomix flava]|uniref:Nucleotidyltransferase-like protein n=1 Tax=Sediminitomix flava TaxID=379075 RepID=A0A315YYY8_SEDFL|nr:sugar phosphate nucleotidyltransferase [Sediminitomix flava]PWJ34118.1 nucleotidyltransferase-like protein [Sediminitomix flava]